MRNFDEDKALRMILEGTSGEVGAAFFRSLVKSLAEALGVHAAIAAIYHRETTTLEALGFCMGGQIINGYTYNIAGTPCEMLIRNENIHHLPDNLQLAHPEDADMKEMELVSYLGVPLKDLDGRILGTLAVMDKSPLPDEPRSMAVFQIFAARAAAELRRMQAEEQVREREQQLGSLLDSAMDGIIKLSRQQRISLMNVAAGKIFNCNPEDMPGKPFPQFLDEAGREKLTDLMDKLDARPEGKQYLWIPSGINIKTVDGKPVEAEATLSRFSLEGEPYYTLILRNVNERVEAEKKIRSLMEQTLFLRRELEAVQEFGDIVGQSGKILRVLKDVKRVAPTDATVLIHGETGTGKELIAHAIHNAGKRCDKPMVKVNCAALPAALMESEFFGHVAGAFTGATGPRNGRFLIANNGTIFLDEIGEMPLDLQAKLLRVLQESEFEPVGSSDTIKVNVRVIAATNRNLPNEIQQGRFREDLYYRLSVFPITVPPLRERCEDIPLLAQSFLQRLAKRMGRPEPHLTDADIRRLEAYTWPGNIRELQNVIERALIASPEGQFHLERALPEPDIAAADPNKKSDPLGNSGIRTEAEMQALERANIIRALNKCAWKVSGENGAAALLGMKPTTLSSRIKALGITRPQK